MWIAMPHGRSTACGTGACTSATAAVTRPAAWPWPARAMGARYRAWLPWPGTQNRPPSCVLPPSMNWPGSATARPWKMRCACSTTRTPCCAGAPPAPCGCFHCSTATACWPRWWTTTSPQCAWRWPGCWRRCPWSSYHRKTPKSCRPCSMNTWRSWAARRTLRRVSWRWGCSSYPGA